MMVLSGENMVVGTWYRNKFPTDEYGNAIRNDLTFGDLWDCLKEGVDFYSFTGAYDSLVRERLFVKLAEIFNVSYEYVYGMWIASDRQVVMDRDIKWEGA